MGRKRGDPSLDPSLRALVQQVGKDKLSPDISAQEKYHSRSLTIRRKVLEFLVTHDGTTWANVLELHARAANYADCSSVTAARWVHQFTRVGAPCELIEAVDHWMLARRGNGEARR
jgi:hypothetical protein